VKATKRHCDNQLEPQQQTALSILERPGQPLDTATRATLEPRFGHNFGDVRVHSGIEAASTAHEFGARAFVVGQDIVMGADQYAPQTSDGLELLAHELTHTVQQRAAPRHIKNAPLEISERSSSSEREARDVRDSVMRGGSAGAICSSGELSLAREDDPTSSNISDWFALPAAMTGGGMMGVDPISQAFGFAGNLEKAATADNGWGVASGLAGAGANVASLTSFMGGELANGGVATLGSGAMNALGGIAGGLNAVQGVSDGVNDWRKGDYFKALAADGTKAGSGIASAIGSAATALAPAGTVGTLLGEGGVAGLMSTGSLGAGALLTTEVGALGGSVAAAGAAGGTAAAVGTGAAIGGAVLGSAAAGVAAGYALDQGTGKLMRSTGAGGLMDRGIDAALNFTGAGAVMDSVGGGSAAAGSRGDYTISDMMARGMTGADQLVTAGMRGVGLVDESRPAYTQTLGWRLASLFD
jgi:Domain of unknown function (DUF4157)